MHDRTRYKLLFGPYLMPRCQLGKKLFCEIRGWVAVKRLSDGRIPWPQTRKGAFILCGDLVQAVRRESNLAVCYWWGVTPQTVSVWRKALDVPRSNRGSKRLWQINVAEVITPEVHARAVANANSPEANWKKAAAKIGKPRPRHVIEAIRKANVGRRLSA
jgi:hypothetical protein